MMLATWTSSNRETQYEKLTEAEDRLLEESSVQSSRDAPVRSSGKVSLYFWVGSLVNAAMLLASILFFASSRITPNAAAKVLYQHSAYLDSATLKLKDVVINGTLFPPENPPFSRAEPGDSDAEAMWEYFEPSDFFPITRDELIRIGKDPETSVKFPNEAFGFGDEAYVASFDVLHKIHCLNELRKSTFANYPMEQVFSGSDHDLAYRNQTHSKLWWLHLRHCTDLLAQDLICHADSDLMTYTWRDMQPFPYPDMSLNRKCRDFDQLLEWNNERRVPADKYNRVMKWSPEVTTKMLPHEPQLYQMNGFEDSVMFPDGRGFDEWLASSRR